MHFFCIYLIIAYIYIYICYAADRFTVASYNILGDRNAFAHRDMYRNVPSHYLKWDHRKRVICDELVQWNPDIICLQVSKVISLINLFVFIDLLINFFIFILCGLTRK